MTALPAMPSSSVARATDLPSSASRCSPPAALRSGVIADPYIPNLHWVPIDLAAQAMSVTPQALRLRAPELRKGGLAKQLSPTVGGQAKWHFSTHFDARLAALVSGGGTAAGVDPESDSSDSFARFRAAPKDRQTAAVAKATAVQTYRQWRRSPTTRLCDAAHQAALMKSIAARGGMVPKNIRRVYEWNDLVATLDLGTGAGFQAACWELLDRRGGNREAGYSGEAWDAFKALYLRDNKLSVRQCWEAAGAEARKQGWTWVSLSRAKQLVHELLPASVRTLAREGYEDWQRKFKPSIIQNPDAWAVGECAETDQSECDFFCRDVRGGKVVAARPILTTFLDRRSRRILGWSLGWNSDSDAIRAALHDALRRDDVSVPQHVVLDNGKAFASQQFSGVTKKQRQRGGDPSWPGLFAMLGIQMHFATPYNHNGKPRQERAYGVSHQDFDRTLDSWSGSGGASGGRDPDKIKALLANPIKLPTLDDIRPKFAQWVEHYNHKAERNIEALVDESGRHLSSAEWYATRLPKFRPLENKATVLRCLEHQWSAPRSVTKNGVSIKIAGRTRSYGQYALADLVGSGRKVYVTYDPNDLNSVRVYNEDFGEICVAPKNQELGGTLDTPTKLQDLKTALARVRQHQRDTYRQVDIAAATSSIDDLAMMAARDREVAETRARMQADGIENPTPMRLVRSPLGGSPNADDSSRIPLRKAAGAEHDDFPLDIQRFLNPASPAVEAGSQIGPFSLLDALGGDQENGPRQTSSLIGTDILGEIGA